MDALTKADVQVLLENLSSQYENKKALDVIKHQKGRIETIRRLTGGIPRTIILLYEIILDESASVFEDLEGILDKITPLYKHRMEDLATQQQVIVDAIALNWDGILTSEISKTTNLEPKAISSQLKILEKNGFITSELVNKKNKIYMLRERFFNIWYLMRYGRKKKKQQVLWLAGFLKEWCTEDELIQKAKNHITLARTGSMSQRGGYYMAEALSQSIQDMDLRYDVLTSTKKFISQTHPELAKNLSDADEMVFTMAVKAHHDSDLVKAEKYYLMAVEHEDVKAMVNLGVLYNNEYKDVAKAEKYYLMAVEHEDVKAMFNLGLLYEDEHKDVAKAEKYYLMAVEHEDVKAMFKLAVLYETEIKDFKKSERYYSKAIETDFRNNMAYLIQAKFANEERGNIYLELCKKYHTKRNPVSILTLSIMMIHAEKYKESMEYFHDFLAKTKGTDDFQLHITNYVILMIAKKQYHLVIELFQEEKYHLKEKIKPVYFALMSLMKEEYPKEYKRMGTEIKDTVDEILDRIKALED